MRYVPTEVQPSVILQAIEELGFKPRLEDVVASSVPTLEEQDCKPFPEPIGTALEEAKRASRPLFLDFFAEWCAPCQTLDEEILTDPAVKSELERFRFQKVDTDLTPEAAQCLRVFGLPTIVVLGPGGQELLRHEGLLEAADLARRLAELSP